MIARMIFVLGTSVALAGFLVGVADSSYRHYFLRYADDNDRLNIGMIRKYQSLMTKQSPEGAKVMLPMLFGAVLNGVIYTTSAVYLGACAEHPTPMVGR